MLKEGDKAPEFTVQDASGEQISLADFRGRKVVLYFYPKDDTPGCTKQACNLRDSYHVFEERGIKVLGASLDTPESHREFAAKYNLPFTLLADTDRKLAEAYDVYGEQVYPDGKFMGVARKTFLIDEEGRIKKVFNKVSVTEHADEVLAGFQN